MSRRSKEPGRADPDERHRKPEAAFGDRLRELRTTAGLTQEELAHRSGLHWTYIGQVERGLRNPTYRTILRIAQGLDLGPADLVSADDLPEPGKAAFLD